MPEFKVTRYRIRTENAVRGSEQPFSVVFLSDLHNMTYGEDNSTLLQEIRNENPEAVLIAGDMLTADEKDPQMEAAISLMRELTRKYPVYYANGNHECRLKCGDDDIRAHYERYVNMIRSFGVHVLENTAERFDIYRMPFKIWGLEIPMECYRRLARCRLTVEQVEELIGKPDPDAFNILLAHHPVYFDTYAAWGADLTLSGHLHGGIVRLPVLGGVISPQFRLFPKYDKGLFSVEGKKLIVSSGMGSHTIPLRINNPPEMVVIDFVG